MPAYIYKLADGTRVPSVTTINKIGQDSGGLIHWAWNLGMDGKDYRQARDDAAEGGTFAHVLVQAAIENRTPDLSGFSEDARIKGEMSFSAYKEWRDQTRIEILRSEVPLVSETYRFGGCLDAVGRSHNGQLCLLDWKSGALYSDYLCQIAAYRELWNERMSDQQIEGGFHLCRFNKETGDFSHAYFGNLSEAWEAFKLKRSLYDLLARLKKRV